MKAINFEGRPVSHIKDIQVAGRLVCLFLGILMFSSCSGQSELVEKATETRNPEVTVLEPTKVPTITETPERSQTPTELLTEVATEEILEEPTAEVESDPVELATPMAESPASGICAETEGKNILIIIFADLPSPRCAIVQGDQILTVQNARDETITVSLGLITEDIEVGESWTADRPIEEYLLPGVHQVIVEPCCSPEIWFKE